MAEKLLQGKVALITGGSRGIGRAISEMYAAHGARVVINYSAGADKQFGNPAGELLKSIQNKYGNVVRLHQADIAQVGQHQAMIDDVLGAFGSLDILVNNVGICPFVPLHQLTPEIYDQTFAVNIRGPTFLTQRAVRAMLQNPLNEYGLRGSIINIGSISGKNTGGNLQHHYCQTKAALHAFTATLAQDLGPKGIRANTIAPGVVFTDMNKTAFAQASQKEIDAMLRAIPLRRGATPDDIAGSAVYLGCDELSRYVTGALVDVSGGLHVVVAGDELEN
ncbi:MAG TPA: SDR family NAD(P)-dependent oxidoreductase [Candidatus Nanoarchaeia archaeon]|nr:SDR family NAD(P)-dependent oxidoreductase [Candidatus Nanoarchaeia archaeon]